MSMQQHFISQRTFVGLLTFFAICLIAVLAKACGLI